MEELELDKNLWFYHKGCSGKHYFIGNPHTFPGRILAWCTEQQRSFFLSVSEIEKMSDFSKYWVKGYLYGNEPSPPKNKDGDVQFSGEEYDEWKESVELFETTGFWRDDNGCCTNCGENLLKSNPLTLCKKCEIEK